MICCQVKFELFDIICIYAQKGVENFVMIYQRIRDLREDKDKKQNEIAQMLKIGISTYQRYERGETPITLEVAEQLANFYDVSLDYIAGRSKDKKGLCKSELQQEENELITMFRELTERRKGEIIGNLKTLYNQQTEETAKRKEVI